MRLVGFCPDRGAGLHDRKLVAAEALRGALRAGKVLGADALVHARPMVVASEKVAERLQRLGLRRAPTIRPTAMHRAPACAAPSRSPSASSTRASANLPLALGGLIAGEAADRRRIDALLPQPRLPPRRRSNGALGQCGLAAMKAA